MDERFLVADIGGTNARFAVAATDGDAVTIGDMRVFRVKDYETIADAANDFLHALQVKVQSACFAVAAPITDEIINFTNSRWMLDVAKVKRQLSLDILSVLNDFAALAESVRRLRDEDFVSVKSGTPVRSAPQLVLGPGTGFGQSIILPAGKALHIVSTQGGHVAFAPHDDEEIAVLRFIARSYGRVSIERLLSGRGLANIYRALCAVDGTLFAAVKAEEIGQAALKGEQPTAVKAVDMFFAILGSVAGDAVLSTGARGGVILGGGILPKIRTLLPQSKFGERFLDKGRMREYVETVPVKLIIADGAALIGAAHWMKSRMEAQRQGPGC